MSIQVNVLEAKTQLSRLLEQVEAGEEVIIARAGHPVARLISLKPQNTARALGALAGKGWVSEDFDEPLLMEVALPLPNGVS
jgi:prevent-host-death family protein